MSATHRTAARHGRVAETLSVLALAGALALGATLPARPAAASDAATALSQAQGRLAAANDSYDQANAEVERLAAEMDDTQGRIDEIEAQLPERREAAATAIRATYRLQQGAGGLVELILSSDSFYEALQTVFYLDSIQNQHFDAIQDLVDLTNELEASKQQLQADKDEAEQRRQEALDAVSDAEAARDELRALAGQEAAAEEAERQEAIREASAGAADGKTFTNASGDQVPDEAPDDTGKASGGSTSGGSTSGGSTSGESTSGGSTSGGTTTTDPVPQPDARSVFVSTWTTRIDSYLAGSPLAGHGRTFAESAWDYGVDPRWSPAIACIESGKGRYCANTCNAWGMTAVGGGWCSWPDWDTAIRSAVRYLSGYGYTISLRAASIYCPPGGEWYAAVSSQMRVVWPSDSI